MNNKSLKTAYSPEDFRKLGHQLVDQLADHIDENLTGKTEKAIEWNTPEDEYRYWKKFLKNGEQTDVFSRIISRTTHVHHPKCIGHQVAPTIPITALMGMISTLLNNGMAVYEMGMAPSAIERVITEWLCKKIGYAPNARGFLTSGGTLANLTALLSARKAKVADDVWNKGLNSPLGIMVSEEAHYCIDRAAKIMGLGEKGIIKVPAKANFAMDVSRLEERYQNATAKGIQIFAIVGSAPSTATGAYDNLSDIANFAKKHNLWFHVDGAHGGAALFSLKYRHTLHGVDNADSVVIDGHKMMMMPTITTALLFKDGNHSHATFSQKADYLLVQSEDEDWYNLAKRTFECTKTMMSIHWFAVLKTYGEDIFREYVTRQYDLGHKFAAMIQSDGRFELAVEPMCNIVCFRFIIEGLDTESLNSLNAKIRERLLAQGEFYVVQTKLRGIHYLRTTIMNPFTTEAHLRRLLEKIGEVAESLRNV